MNGDELADLKARVARLEQVVFADGPHGPLCTCTMWTSSIPPMPSSDGTCPKHPKAGIWFGGREPK